jgi:hypothetical protein
MLPSQSDAKVNTYGSPASGMPTQEVRV